jgi:hypothetical protein
VTFAVAPLQAEGFPPEQFCHVLSVWSDGTGRVSGFYQLFGQIGFAIRVADDADRTKAGVSLCQNPLTGKWDERHLDVATLPPCSAIDVMTTRMDEGEAAFHRLLRLATAKMRAEAEHELIQKSVERSFPGEGEIIQEHHIESLSRSVAERIVARVFGGTAKTELSGERIAEQLRALLSDARDSVKHAEIAEAAYFRWINRGCSHGNDVEDWLAAERELHAASK